MSRLIASVAAFYLFSSAANAITIYDESVDGDAAPAGGTVLDDPLAFHDLGVLSPGQNIILGSVQGHGVETFDGFGFTVNGAWSLEVLAYTPGAGNLSTGFALYNPGAATNRDYLVAQSVFNPRSDVFSGHNGPGAFVLGVYENAGTTASLYSVAITVAAVPEPAAAPLLATAVAALGFAGWRRSRPRAGIGGVQVR